MKMGNNESTRLEKGTFNFLQPKRHFMVEN